MIPIDPAFLSIAIMLGKEIAAFIQREGRQPSEMEIATLLSNLRQDNKEIDDLLNASR